MGAWYLLRFEFKEDCRPLTITFLDNVTHEIKKEEKVFHNLCPGTSLSLYCTNCFVCVSLWYAIVFINKSEVSTFSIVVIFSMVVCLMWLYHHILSVVSYRFRESCCFCFHYYCTVYAGLILGLRPANERRRYFLTTSLFGWAQTLNQPCLWWPGFGHGCRRKPLSSRLNALTNRLPADKWRNNNVIMTSRPCRGLFDV